jgi:hypothetical protein
MPSGFEKLSMAKIVVEETNVKRLDCKVDIGYWTNGVANLFEHRLWRAYCLFLWDITITTADIQYILCLHNWNEATHYYEMSSKKSPWILVIDLSWSACQSMLVWYSWNQLLQAMCASGSISDCIREDNFRRIDFQHRALLTAESSLAQLSPFHLYV